jgi:phage/plasmid-like protein (TIGR03299 family)
MLFMSHQINVSENGRANVFVVREPAWHKLGQVLNKPATAEEAIKEAGLDFTVVKKRIQTEEGIAIPNFYATVRADNNVPFGVVSNRYEILQNVEAFKFFDAIVERDEAVYHSAGVLGKGERVWIMAKLPEYVRIAGTDDVSQVYVTLLNGHDGKYGIKAFVHVERIVCNNTLQVALRQAKQSGKIVNFRHDTGVVDRVTDGAELLGIVNQYRTEVQDIFTTLSKEKVTKVYRKAFTEALFPLPPKEILEKMKREPVAIENRAKVLQAIEYGFGQEGWQNTKWGLYNGATFFLDNMRKGHGDNASKKQSSLWFGDSARVRQRAFDLLTLDTDSLGSLGVSLN